MATAGTQTARKTKKETLLVSASAELVALTGSAVMVEAGADGTPSAIRLLPAGEWKMSKGTWLFDAEAAKSVLAAAEKYGNDYHFDYGHASVEAAAMDPAHAGKSAGWHKLSVRNGELWTEGLEWTPAAQQMLANKEYRYFSPTVLVDKKTRRVVEYVNTALTNRPATFAMRPLVASQDLEGDEEISQESPKMKLVLSALGLTEAASEAEALDAVTRVRASQKQLSTLTGKADLDEALGVVAAWKLKAEDYATVSAKLEKIEADRKEAEVVTLVAEAVKAGKLPPSLQQQTLDAGRQNIAYVKAFLENIASKVAPDTKLEDKRPPVVTASAELDKVARANKLDPAAVAAHFAKKQAEWAAEDGTDAQ